MSGTFGRELSEALVFLFQHMSTSHPLLADEMHHVLLERNVSPDDDAAVSPKAQLRLLLDSPTLLGEGTWARRRACINTTTLTQSRIRS